jgi:type IV secretory pathway TrbD component
MRVLIPLLYWVGLLIALVGVGLRFWLGEVRLGLTLALIGVALIVAARLAHALRRRLARGR